MTSDSEEGLTMAIRSGGAPLHVAAGIREFARATPAETAVIDGGRRFTFAALHERSNRLACGLLTAGLRPGARVAVLLGNRAEYLEAAAATAKAGLVLVPVNPRSTPAEVEYVLGHSGAAAVLMQDGLGALLPEDAPGPRISVGGVDAPDYEAFLAAADAVDPLVEVDELDPWTIVYTSGTTGRPKGVVLSHRARALTFITSAREWGYGPGSRSVAVAPMYHGAGMSYSYGPVWAGGSVTILPRWDPEQFLHLVERDAAQVSFLVPTHAQTLRAHAEDALRGPATASLRTLYFNAAPLAVALKTWVLDALPHVGVHELYGSTEAGVVANLRPADAARKAGTVGPPWLHTEVRLVGPDGEEVGPGEPGELFSRAPWLMTGYLDDPAATAACTTADGFLSAGDLATVDDEGHLAIVGRTKDMIITGGVNVHPREIEELIAAHPGVAEVAVVGLTDTTWGEAVTAFVVPRRPGLDLADVAGGLEGRLARYKLPRGWHLLDELPHSTAGKVLKRELKAAWDPTGM